jgi:hypothetical protein
MLAGGIDNNKLNNSSITLNGQSMNLGLVYSLPNTSITNAMLAGSIANSKLTNSSITIGTTTMSLGSTYTTITGGTPLNTYLTFAGGIPITYSYGLDAIPTLTIANVLTVGHLLLQTYNQNSYIDNTDSSTGAINLKPQINIGTILPNQAITIGSDTTTVQLTAPSLSPLSIKATAQSQNIPYLNVKFKDFIGGVYTNVISPNWARITNTAGTSTLEVKIYTFSSTGTFKIEGQIVNFYVSTNTVVVFNIASFHNSASTATQSSLVKMLDGNIFVARNYSGGAGATYITPYITYCTFMGATPGDYFTFTAYFQSGSSFANGSNVGRTASDIPTNMFVTQIA